MSMNWLKGMDQHMEEPERHYPPKAILGTAYEFATGQRLASGDFEGGKTGASPCSESWDSPSSRNDQPGKERRYRRLRGYSRRVPVAA